MSLLTICNQLAENVGLETTQQVMTSPKREWAEAVVMSNAVGEELARRVDFGALRKSILLVGTGGNQSFELDPDVSRIAPGTSVTYGVNTGPIIRPLTQAEWSSLEPVEGTPRYYRLGGRVINFWPYMGSGQAAVVRAYSSYWCSNGSAAWMEDTDTALIDETLMVKGLIVRWRRQKGMDFGDYEAEYEAALTDIAKFDDRSRF